MDFTHLHVHSHYSLLDGMSKVEEIVDKCIASGMNAVALTDHGNMYGIKELLDYCKKINNSRKTANADRIQTADADRIQTADADRIQTADADRIQTANADRVQTASLTEYRPRVQTVEFAPFKPIVGCEVYCARRGRLSRLDDKAVNGEGKTYTIDRSGWHLILLAKNMTGYHNLCRIVSAGFMADAYYHTPRIDKELLEMYHEGIICTSACLGGELAQKVLGGLQTVLRTDRVQTASLTEYRVQTVLRTDRVQSTDRITDLIEEGVFKEAEETVQWFKNLFGEDYYIELQRHETQRPGGDQETYQRQKQVNPVLIELAKKYDVKVICTNDAHFVNEEDAEAHDRLICLSTNHYVNDVDRMHYTKQEWLKTPEEMYGIFQDIPEALANTQEIVNKVEIYDIDHDPIMPLFDIPESFGTEAEWRRKFTEQQLFDEFTRDENGNIVMSREEAEKRIKKLGGYDRLYRIKFEADYLKHLTYKGAHERYGETLTEEQEERIRFELHIMKTMGFPGYFLIVMDFIRAAREELDVSVGPGRGSAAGSVVAYCLHITDLDPLKYDLLFERFLNPDRISLPDIDTDFEDCGRGKVLDWVSRKYGETHVAHIVTYGKMAAKSALADVGRVQQVPLSKVNELKSYIPDREFPGNIKDEKGRSPKVTLRNCYKYIDQLKEEYEGGDGNIRSMLRYAEQLEGTVRQVGVHACGIIIGADDLTNFAPLSSVEDKVSKKRVLVTEYDGHVVESVGLIKMDFLGLITLTIIKECLRNIKKVRNIDIDIDHIPIDDELTYKLFQAGRTVAVFQFESSGMQKYLQELKPTVIGDLIAMNALYRPGPMDYIPQFIRRKQGAEPVTYDIPVMEKYLKDTYGITVYQEQVMLLSRLLANFTRGESDKLRKAMGKKQMAVLQELKGKFMDGGKANGHDEKILDKIWKDWEKFASYAFNKSHAACYSWVAYQTGYLKAHYPAEFMAANLTVHKDDIKEVTKLMDECRALKINVLEPDVNESELTFTVNSHGDIRFGLGGIKGVGEGAAEAIIQEREQRGKYKDLFDFLERVNLQSCNRKTIENLAQAGAFECFDDVYREQILGVYDDGDSVLERLMLYGNRYQQDKEQSRNSLFGDLDAAVEIKHPDLPDAARWNTIERLNKEKDLIGIYLSAHPLDEYEFEVKEMCNLSAQELTRFDSWRRPDARAIAEQQMKEELAVSTPVQTEPAQEETLDYGEEENTDDIPTTNRNSGNKQTEQMPQEKRAELPSEFIHRMANQPCRIGGIITEAEQLVSQKGNPYGRYTIEDYTGSYQLVMFGNTYRQFAPLMQKNIFVLVTGIIQQRNAGSRWFKEVKEEEAEYEFMVLNVDLLKDVQDKQTGGIRISLPVSQVSDELVEELSEQIEHNPGNGRVHLQLTNPMNRHQVALTSRKYSIHVTPHLYRWLCRKRQEGILSFSVVTNENNS